MELFNYDLKTIKDLKVLILKYLILFFYKNSIITESVITVFS